MSNDHMKYLAANVLSDGKTITYRSLSRALKVHCNTAKRMLYEFHHKENTSKKGSVHATYLILGTKQHEQSEASAMKTDDTNLDVTMQSSPYMESSLPVPHQDEGVLGQVLTLVNEQSLTKVKASYKLISSIHVYSVGPGKLQNLQILSHASHEVFVIDNAANKSSEDNIYGTIKCRFVEKRHRSGVNSSLTNPEEGFARVQPRTSIKPEAPTRSSLQGNGSDSLEEAPKTVQPSEQRPKKPMNVTQPKGGKSNLAAAFAKAKPKSAQVKQSNASQSLTSKLQDTASEKPSAMVSDSDTENEEMIDAKPSTGKLSKARKEREQQLRNMMDEEDDVDTAPQNSKGEEDVTMDMEPEPEPEPQLEPEGKSLQPANSTGGRRRGRRRIVKKTTTRDAEGFLVTREEPAWESFSEDEAPEPTKQKPTVVNAKAKKGGGKGSGNIMSFFGKK